MATPKDVLTLCKENEIQFVDLRFTDLIGTLQHFTVPVEHLSEDSFTDGFGFDGSSIRGWQAINESDMIVIPDPSTAKIDPFYEHPTVMLLCNIFDPLSKQAYDRDPRYIAQKAVAYLKSTGIADTVFVGPEAEFFVFDKVSYSNDGYHARYEVNNYEASHNAGADGEAGFGIKVRPKEGYFPVAPQDTLQDLRSEMTAVMNELGLNVECHHHEVASAGQCEIDMKFDTLVEMADKVMLYKYIVKNVAWLNGKTATFMPKPVYGDNGSGMHTHQSLWKDGKPLFAGDKYAGLSETALYYIGGILKHSRAILAISAPTTNSYKRLVPGYEAPVNLAYSSRNRSAAIRIPMYSHSPKAKRIEFRSPDPACNPYLSFAAQLLAGLDGVINKIDPGAPLEMNIYELPEAEAKKIPTVPGSLDEALDALASDYEFLLRGGVFTKDLIDTYIEYRREQTKALKLRPHPYEFFLYSDV